MAHTSFTQNAQKIALTLLTFVGMSLSLTMVLPGVASASLCDEVSKGTGGFFSCGTETTSFTEFTGTLSAPDASQYAPGLSQNQDLRTFIKNVVNFALGFLGLIAVVIIIYGGFLYVTAAGNEEQAGKGKKAITYPLIGIIIILSSFALVNTVLLAGTGSDQGAGGGSAPNVTSQGDQNAQRKALFAYAGSVVQTVARDFVTAYQNYSEINLDLATLRNTDFLSSIQSATDFKANLQQKRSILANIVSKAGALSQMSEVGRNGLVLIDAYLTKSNDAIAAEANEKEKTDSVKEWFKNLGINFDELKSEFDSMFGAEGMGAYNKKDFAQAVAKSREKLVVLYDQIKAAGISPEVEEQFKLVINEGLNTLITGDNDAIASLQKFDFSRLVYDTAFAQGVSTSITLAREVDNATVLQIVNYLSKLYDLVKDLQFVYTVITADKSEGNAPLLVNVDGLKSLDPNNQTIADTSYHWDFGDGKGEATGVTQSNIYTMPGTYVVKLRIDAPEPGANQKKPANGIAFKTITVKPSSSKIDLVATVNGKDYPLSRYSGSIKTVDVDQLPVTTKEAKDGIKFSAKDTKIGTGSEAKDLNGAAPPAQVRWDFGDKSLGTANTRSGSPDNDSLTIPNVKYEKEGNYRVLLQVTDERGQIDSKFVNVNVSPIVARFTVTPSNVGDLTQEFSFDGSDSSSDASSIQKYFWTIKDAKGNPEKNPDGTDFKVEENKDNFKHVFSKSGRYTVSLKVSDGASDSLEFSSTVTVNSKPTVAQFSYNSPDPTHPNIYVFDGSGSYDPDGYDGQILSYNWEVNPADCVYYKWLGTESKWESGNGTPCSKLKEEGGTTGKGFSEENERIKVKFNGKNKYTARLDVQDVQNDPGNSTPLEQAIQVDNLLDVAWGGTDDGAPIVCQLGKDSVDGKCKADDKNTKVTFTVYTEHGIACEVDTGDGAKEQCSKIDSATHIGTATHTYTTAGSYKAKLTVYDQEDNANAINRKVFIGGGEAPTAAFSAMKDSENVAIGPGEVLEGNRKTVFTFDGSPSMNLDGSRRNLTYSWDFGDGTDKSTKKTVTHVFEEASKEQNSSSSPDYAYTVSLSVSDQETGKVSGKDEVKIHIRKEPPVISGLVAVPVTSNNVTPVQVKVSAAGATDTDGKIVSYKWWYEQIQPTPDDTPLGVQLTTAESATLTIGTNGEEKEKHTYRFQVAVTDNEGQTFSSTDLPQSSLPTLEVINGPNKAPVAKFSVDKTSVFVCSTPDKPEQCDIVNFSSSSTDPDKDGKIESYMWNFEGKGYTLPGDKDYDKANVSYMFTKPAKDGVQVRLKVRDNNGGESVSDPVKIFVDAKSTPPVAAFTSTQTDPNKKKIQFSDKSTADEANGAKLKSWAWDFDINSDFNGDGKNDNDVQATDQNPPFEYPNFGIYRAKLTVTDDQGGTANVSNFVNVKAPVVTQTQQTSTPLDARLTTTPAASVADGRVHLQGDSGNVTFDFTGSTGDIKTYIIDKNVYFDGNGNGVKDDDEDYKATKAGTWTTPFARNYGNIRVRLTVIDGTGKKDTVDKDVVFDAPPPPPSSPTPPPASGSTTPQTGTGTQGKNQLSAFVLAGYEVVDWQLLLVSVAGFGIFIASTLNKKKHDRSKSK